MYSELQKGLFPLVSVPVMALLYLLYRFGHLPMRGKRGYTERMSFFYSFASSALWSKFLFQALPNATGPTNSQVGVLVTGFIMIGFFIMLCIQKCQRVSHSNKFYTSPELNVLEIRSIIDHERMEMTEYHQLTDLESSEITEDRLRLEDEVAELRKRRRIAYLLVAIMIFLAVMEGFFVVFSEPAVLGGSWAVFSFFVVNKLIDTLIVGVSLLHGYIHVQRQRGPKHVYLTISLIWSIVCGLSPMPALVEMQWSESFKMVNHLATSIFYAFAGGFLLWLAVYYIWIDKRREDVRDVKIQLIIFAATAGVCCLVAFFV